MDKYFPTQLKLFSELLFPPCLGVPVDDSVMRGVVFVSSTKLIYTQNILLKIYTRERKKEIKKEKKIYKIEYK